MRKTARGPSPRVRGRTAVEEKAQVAAEPPALEPDALWPVAMLRIAMELKRPEAPGLEEIIAGVVSKMGIPKQEFERYLSLHLGTLRDAVRKKGYAP